MRTALLTTGVLATAIAALAMPATAQSFWLDRETSELSLEVLNPRTDGGDLNLASVAVFATGVVQISDESLLVIEIPVSHTDEFWAPEPETAVGNPYIGLQTIPAEVTGLRWAGGIRFPLASDANSATGTGLMSSATDRYEAFIPDLFAVDGGSRYVVELDDVAYLSGSLRAVAFVPTEEGDTEIFLQYGARTWVASQGLNAGVGLSGRYLATESGMTFGDRTIHEVGIWADYAFGSVRPGIRVQLPVGEQMSGLVDQVIGVYVRYTWP